MAQGHFGSIFWSVRLHPICGVPPLWMEHLTRLPVRSVNARKWVSIFMTWATWNPELVSGWPAAGVWKVWTQTFARPGTSATKTVLYL